MSKDTKKSNPEKKPAKASPSVAKAATKKPASVTAVKRPKAVQKKPAAPSSAKPVAKAATPPAKTQKAAKGTTTILVQADVGFGNQLFVRGEGPGLSWDRGAPMQYKESNQWEWFTQGAKEEFPFKVLINDQVWAQGENDKVNPGETKVIQPAF